MIERAFIGPDRRCWFVRPRLSARRDEGVTHVVLELMTDGEIRVVSCLREEWELPAPDFASLLARSVAGGASRAIHRDEALPRQEAD
jgi:hypothetical protein